MEVQFTDDNLNKLETDSTFTCGWTQAIVKAFRRRMLQIRAAKDERDFYALKSLRFEKLKGTRQNQHSMRLNDQYRLIIELESQSPTKIVKIISIEGFHYQKSNTRFGQNAWNVSYFFGTMQRIVYEYRETGGTWPARAAKKLTPEQRKEIGRKAAQARWANQTST